MFRLFALVCALFCATNALRGETFLVLPFYNLSKSANIDWVGESISETIREGLSAEGILTIERDDRREAYRRLSMRPNSHLTKASIVVLGESLDADQIIYGSFELIPSSESAPKGRGSLRITAQMVDLKKIKLGPEYVETGALEDLAKLQTHLAWQTLQFVMPGKSPSEQEFLKQQPAIRLGALENYVRGLLAVSADQKLKLFTEAVRLDPKYSQANYQLGRLHWQKKNYKLAADALMQVNPADEHYREAIFLLGLCRFQTGDFAGAQSAFQLVAEAVPLNEVWNNLGAAQSRRNLPDALQNFQKALEGDSSDPDYQFNVGYALLKQGNFAAAADRFRAVLDRDPGDVEATTMLGRCLKKISIRATEPRTQGLERLKNSFEESAYRQLKAVLEPKR